jgi:hypothetical protein
MTRVNARFNEHGGRTYTTLALPMGVYSLKSGKKALVTAMGPHKLAFKIGKS